METQEQHKKQYDWLKGYQFVKGQSGNPGGRPKGSKSLKTFVREYLESLPDEEKIEYLKNMNLADVWRMGEGNPHSTESGEYEVRLPKPISDVLQDSGLQENSQAQTTD